MAREIGHNADTHKDSNNAIYNTYLDQSHKSQDITDTTFGSMASTEADHIESVT